MDDLLGELLGGFFEVALEVVGAIFSPVFKGLRRLLRFLFGGLVWLFWLSTRGIAAALQRPTRSTSSMRGPSNEPGSLKPGTEQAPLLDSSPQGPFS